MNSTINFDTLSVAEQQAVYQALAQVGLVLDTKPQEETPISDKAPLNQTSESQKIFNPLLPNQGVKEIVVGGVAYQLIPSPGSIFHQGVGAPSRNSVSEALGIVNEDLKNVVENALGIVGGVASLAIDVLTFGQRKTVK